ncbi:MAG: transposase [Ktedonobacterales bacterium]|nr:transposase [Ktedonobacterales bacterium]
MTKAYGSDGLWAIIAPLLPPEPAKPRGGRPRLSDRAALNGILFVLQSGIGWEHLPQELGWGSGRRGICPRFARRGVESSERLGRHRWVVERTFAWLNRFRRLVVRYERRADLHLAFTLLGCSLICFRFLPA